MSQVSAKLRRVVNGYVHWCPGCARPHLIYDNRWQFNGNLDRPTFNPSVVIADRVDHCCHYFLHAGVLKFLGDSMHALAGRDVSLPDLPDRLKD